MTRHLAWWIWLTMRDTSEAFRRPVGLSVDHHRGLMPQQPIAADDIEGAIRGRRSVQPSSTLSNVLASAEHGGRALR